MKNVIYQKKVGEVKIAEAHGEYIATRTFIVLTEEVNRLVVWESTARDEDDELLVIKTFSTYERTEAIEFAVRTAAEAIEDGRFNEKGKAA